VSNVPNLSHSCERGHFQLVGPSFCLLADHATDSLNPSAPDILMIAFKLAFCSCSWCSCPYAWSHAVVSVACGKKRDRRDWPAWSLRADQTTGFFHSCVKCVRTAIMLCWWAAAPLLCRMCIVCIWELLCRFLDCSAECRSVLGFECCDCRSHRKNVSIYSTCLRDNAVAAADTGHVGETW